MSLRRSERLRNKPISYLDSYEDSDEDSLIDLRAVSYSDSDYEAELHCICKQAEDERIMILCDNCHIWHHHNCVHLTKKKVQSLSKSKKKWFCPSCTKKLSKKKRKTNKKKTARKKSKKRSREEIVSTNNISPSKQQRKRRRLNPDIKNIFSN